MFVTPLLSDESVDWMILQDLMSYDAAEQQLQHALSNV